MAKSITISLPHELTREDAKRRIMLGIQENKARFGNVAQVHEQWQGDRVDFKATAMGQTVSGRADVLDTSVRIEIDLPWMLAMMSSRIQNEIESQGHKLLESK